jgi:hypothetical protein
MPIFAQAVHRWPVNTLVRQKIHDLVWRCSMLISDPLP